MKNKMLLEQAEMEVKTFLEFHDLDVDVSAMQKDDAEEFNEIVKSLAKPVSKGTATIAGGEYTLTLKRPQGDLKSITISGMDASDIFAADKAKKNSEMAKMGQMVASMCKIPFAQLNKLTAQEAMLLNKMAALFMAV